MTKYLVESMWMTLGNVVVDADSPYEAAKLAAEQAAQGNLPANPIMLEGSFRAISATAAS